MSPPGGQEVDFNRRYHDQHIARAETEIAVLQIQVKDLDNKVGEIKVELKEIRDSIDKGNEDTIEMIKEFRTDSSAVHKELNEKISVVEKWKWMLMGAGIILGITGFPAIKEILTLFTS